MKALIWSVITGLTRTGDFRSGGTALKICLANHPSVNPPVPGYLPLGLAEIVVVVTDKLIKLHSAHLSASPSSL